MTQAEKLEALIQKAIDGGWLADRKFKSFKKWEIDLNCYGEEATWSEIRQHYQGSGYYGRKEWEWFSNEQLLFNHEFAKALWGEVVEDMPHDGNFDTDDYSQWFMQAGWQYHLKQAVISKDPIEYMYEVTFNRSK